MFFTQEYALGVRLDQNQIFIRDGIEGFFYTQTVLGITFTLTQFQPVCKGVDVITRPVAFSKSGSNREPRPF